MRACCSRPFDALQVDRSSVRTGKIGLAMFDGLWFHGSQYRAVGGARHPHLFADSVRPQCRPLCSRSGSGPKVS
jgi:hypothetical protein